MKKLTLLNAAILTNFGTFELQPISFSEAKKLVKKAEIESAIGHAATADILSDLLEIKIEANRIEYHQKTGETALVLKLNQRPPEGKILDRREMEEIGYEFAILRRLN